MATLIAHYALDEGTGLLLQDQSPSGLSPATIHEYNGYPQWENGNRGTGDYALRFGGQPLPLYTPEDVDYAWGPLTPYTSCNIEDNGLTVYARFKATSGFRWARPLFYYTATGYDWPETGFRGGLYIGASGRVWMGYNFDNYLTMARQAAGSNVGVSLKDDAWHEVYGYHTPRTSFSDPGTLYLYVDGVLQTDVYQAPFEFTYNNTSYRQRWCIGSGGMHNPGTTILWPDTNSGRDNESNGSVDGVIAECKAWCGLLDLSPPPKISSIMFSCNT